MARSATAATSAADLSNTQFAVDALRASGLDPEDEAFVKALVFLQRTQNLTSVNEFEDKVRAEDGSWQTVTSGDDGGSAYYPGNSPAGYIDLPDGRRVPRSYGSMTYALLKTYTPRRDRQGRRPGRGRRALDRSQLDPRRESRR